MSREHWVLLHAAFEEVSRWPSPVRKEVLRWLAPGVFPAAGGRPPEPVEGMTASAPAEDWPEVWRPSPRRRPLSKPKPALRPHKPDRTRILELELLEGMQGHPGASVAELAAIAGVGKSRALWRLHALAERGPIEKDTEGHWRVTLEERREEI
jgi:hypothetical protein